MFKIIDIKHEQENTKWFYVEVQFTLTDAAYLGTLGKYHRALMVPDITAYEGYYNKPESLEYETKPMGDFYEVIFRGPSPYELGLCKTVDVAGEDILQKQEDGSYIYRDHVSSNYITQGAISQLLEMKEHMDSGFCRWGDYPEQAGAFRSGDPSHDFIGIIETLHRFWD